MSHTPQHDRPVMHWVPVVDAQGRTRMEMRWTVEPAQAPAPHVAA